MSTANLTLPTTPLVGFKPTNQISGTVFIMDHRSFGKAKTNGQSLK